MTHLLVVLLPCVLLRCRVPELYYVLFVFYLLQRSLVFSSLHRTPVYAFEKLVFFHLLQANTVFRVHLQHSEEYVPRLVAHTSDV